MNIGRHFPAIVAIVFVAIGSGLIRAGFVLHADSARLLSHGLSATGSVVEVHTEQRRTRDPYPEDIQGQGRGLRGSPGVYVYEVDVPVLRFTTRDGRVVDVSITPVAPGSVAPGAEMEMRYLPDEPQQARPVAELESPVARYALWALGAAALLPGLIIGVARLRRPY